MKRRDVLKGALVATLSIIGTCIPRLSAAKVPQYPDALLLSGPKFCGLWKTGCTGPTFDIASAILGQSAPGVSPFVRSQDGTLFVTRSPADTILFPKTHPRCGEPRYRWEMKPSGIAYGYLLDSTISRTRVKRGQP